MVNESTVQWLLNSNEPWTRYRTLIDLMDLPEEDSRVKQTRSELLDHPDIRNMIVETNNWPGKAFTRHNDASYVIYKFSTLADFGIRASDPGMAAGLEAILSHPSSEGAFQSMVNIPPSFGGSGQDQWVWMSCDSPTLLYILLSMGKNEDDMVKKAVDHLAGLVDENGWRCRSAPELGRFRGPGRKEDPCPIVNVYALKALSLLPEYLSSPAANQGIEMLLSHWENRSKQKLYLFGIGSDFIKIKYPYVWYNLLHSVEVLSRFPQARQDRRFLEMNDMLLNQADEDGLYKAGSIYKAWKEWSFSNKKNPSPWLTFLVLRIQKRLCQ